MLELLMGIGMAVYVAWSIGANDATMSLLAGSGYVNVKIAAVLGAAMAFLGSVFLGHYVEVTIRGKLLLMDISLTDALVIMFSVATWLTISSFRGWPVSTTHSTVGAVIGLGLVKWGLDAVNWRSLTSVVFVWMLSPLIGLLGAVLTVEVLERVLHRYTPSLKGEIKIARRSAVLLLLWSCLASFSGGANDIANATAFLSVAYGSPMLVRVVGGIGIISGLMVLGRRVIGSVGLNLTKLNPMTALSAQVTVASTTLIGTLLGLPLSGTHILVGAVIGVGLTKGIWVNIKGLKEILSTWLATFLATIIICVVTFLAF